MSASKSRRRASARRPSKRRRRRRNPVALSIVLALAVGGATAGALIASRKPSSNASRSLSFSSPAPLPFKGQGVSSGAVAPDFAVTAVDGRSLTLADFRGKPTVLFFMAYWCGSCLNTGHEMQSFHQQYASQGLQVLAVDVDPTSSPAALRQWINADGNPSYTFSLDRGGVTARAYGVKSLDTVILIDRSGHIAFQGIFPSTEDLGRAIQAAIA